jgi:hypothetical protein
LIDAALAKAVTVIFEYHNLYSSSSYYMRGDFWLPDTNDSTVIKQFENRQHFEKKIDVANYLSWKYAKKNVQILCSLGHTKRQMC